MLRTVAVLFGLALVFVGIAGFLPMFITDGLLLGYFVVDSMHNVFHLVTGVIAIMAATNARYAKMYFQIFGTLYTIIAILGFWREGDLFMMHVNLADNVLHVVIGLVALFLGFSTKEE